MKPQLVASADETSNARPHDSSQDTFAALQAIARRYGLNPSSEAVRIALRWEKSRGVVTELSSLAEATGLDLQAVSPKKTKLDALHPPLLLLTKAGTVLVIESISTQGIAGFRRYENDQSQKNERPVADLLAQDCSLFVVRPRRGLTDARIDTYIAPVRDNWLRKTLFPALTPYGAVIVASLFTNLLALAGIVFSMQVYDRVIPAQSYATLAVLFSGVVLAFIFEFFLKQARIILLDVLGRDAGLRLSDIVFGRALRVRNDERPPSTGSFIAQIRDIDTMREAMTSTSVGVLMDLPFFLLFCALFWFIAGPLVLIPIGALLAIIIPGLLLQGKLRDAAQSAQREAALRNAILVESIQGLEDIKAMQAEGRFETIWRQTSAATASAQSSERRIVGGLTSWTQIVQQSVYALTVAIGAPMVMAGDLTTGTLVGASILGSRMIAPMSQVTGVLSRLQQARVGAQGLDKLMKLPIDHPAEENRVSCARLGGAYVFEAATFSHRKGQATALTVPHLTIAPGERIGLVGRNGAGKSTLLQALSGQLLPDSGQVRIDNLSADIIDPSDMRRDIAFLSQNARLFYGTLRDNLMLGNPTASERELQTVLEVTGGTAFLSRFERGWDYQILEGGTGLSGGQKQSILLARLMLRRPSVLLLDEPTSAMDDTTEGNFIARLGKLAVGRSLIVATHRHRILQLVDRLIVLDKGKIVMDGPKDDILAKMRGENR